VSKLDQVREAWADALDVETDAVPLDVSFFDAGGNSLLLLLLWERLTELTARDLKAADLFQHSTVVAQTEFLDGTDERPAAVTTSRSALLDRVRRDAR
jgi:hypothetical protein